jgi:hypothetical protein
VSERFTGVANIEIGFKVVLPQTLGNQFSLFLFTSFHEVTKPQVPVGTVDEKI